MSEIQLQSKMVMKFSQNFPEKRGQLFHVSNERNNPIQAMKAKGIGIFNGVSDLIYFELFHPRENGSPCLMVLGIEIKEPKSRHKREHIENQIEWAETLTKNGGDWRLCRTVEEFMNFVTGTSPQEQGLRISEVKKILKQQKTKTILF